MTEQFDLTLLKCPWCVSREGADQKNDQGNLELVGDEKSPESLRCTQCKRIYKIEEGIPNLLIEEAQTPEKESA